MILYFSKDDILHIHSKLISDFGGSDGIRDESMLESALNTPLQTFDSEDLYPTAVDKVVRLSFGLVMNHPFIDGNKRVGAAVLYLGLSTNNVRFEVSDETMIEEFLNLAAGKLDYSSFLTWVKSKL